MVTASSTGKGAAVRRNRRWLAGVAVLVIGAAAGCADAAPADRTGGHTIVLRLATSDGDLSSPPHYEGPLTFVKELDRLSHGGIRVEVTHDYGHGAGSAESKLVTAIASGDVDGGWPATRAFADAGIHGLEAVEAPLAITNRKALTALVTGKPSERILGELKGSGVVGLALAAGPFRVPMSAQDPLVSVEDWKGVPFRVYNSPVQADAVRALGGEPLAYTHNWHEAVSAGKLRGAELDIAGYATAGTTDVVTDVTANVPLWPKVFVLALSQKRYDALTDQQRVWVRQAAARAGQAAVGASYDDTASVALLCEHGVRVHLATDSQLTGLRTALAPVSARLASNDRTAGVMRVVTDLAARFPGVDVPRIPAGCVKTKAPAGPSIPTQVSELPDGVYRAEIPVAAVEDAGINNQDGFSGIWTLHIDHGTYVLTCRALDAPGHDCGNNTYDGPLEAGDLRGEGSKVWFVYDPGRLAEFTGCTLPVSPSLPGHCAPMEPYSASWAVRGKTLTFQDPEGLPSYYLPIRPWRRIG